MFSDNQLRRREARLPRCDNLTPSRGRSADAPSGSAPAEPVAGPLLPARSAGPIPAGHAAGRRGGPTSGPRRSAWLSVRT